MNITDLGVIMFLKGSYNLSIFATIDAYPQSAKIKSLTSKTFLLFSIFFKIKEGVSMLGRYFERNCQIFELFKVIIKIVGHDQTTKRHTNFFSRVALHQTKECLHQNCVNNLF